MNTLDESEIHREIEKKIHEWLDKEQVFMTSPSLKIEEFYSQKKSILHQMKKEGLKVSSSISSTNFN